MSLCLSPEKTAGHPNLEKTLQSPRALASTKARAVSLVTGIYLAARETEAGHPGVRVLVCRGRGQRTLWRGPASAPPALSARQAAAGLRKCVWRPEPRRAEHGRTRRPWPADVVLSQRPDPTAAGKCCSGPHPALQPGIRLKPAAGQQSFARASRTHTWVPSMQPWPPAPHPAPRATTPAPCSPGPAPRTPGCRVLRTPACAREVSGHSSGGCLNLGATRVSSLFLRPRRDPRPLKG